MAKKRSSYRGCLLGTAVGDLMGYTVNSHSLEEIRTDYGPSGLLGYNPPNGYAEITSHTQLAAFTANGLLRGLTLGRYKGTMSPYINYIAQSHWEWASSQEIMGRPTKTVCWLFHEKSICHRHCLDTRMKELILRKQFRTPEEPGNPMATPTSLCAALGVALFHDPDNMEQTETDRLGLEAVALTHGSPLAFLTGAAVAHLVSTLLANPKADMDELVQQTMDALREQFEREYAPQVNQICALVKQAMALSREYTVAPVDAMERLRCENAPQVLAGALYAVLTAGDDLDLALITAVNHSGASAAVGALVGAILGTRLGAEALPEFYLECLECRDVLKELADDLYQGCPIEKGDIFFDGDWESKYRFGKRG